MTAPDETRDVRSTLTIEPLSRYATTEEILVNVTPQETRVAVMEHGVTHELHIERASARGFVGNI